MRCSPYLSLSLQHKLLQQQQQLLMSGRVQDFP